MIGLFRRLAALLLGRSGGGDDPGAYSLVRNPRKPPNRSGAVALEEPTYRS